MDETEQKTGYWIYNKDTDLANCSECGNQCDYDQYGRIETDICPFCGVKMKAMKQYIRFGNIPTDKKSKIHKSDAILGVEKGVSVWDCAFVNDVPFPLLPNNANENTMADYFYMLFGNKPVYLVEGTELKEKGYVGEPLLGTDIKIIREYTDDYEYLKAIHRK